MNDSRIMSIIIEAENKAKAAFNEVSGQLKTMNSKVKDMEPAFQKMQLAGTVAFGAVSAIVGVSIDNYVEAERSVRQLEHAVISVSKGNQEQVDSILAVTDALQKKAGIDGDALTMGAAQLSTFGLQTQSVLDLTTSLADLTVNQAGLTAGSEDYIASANVMAKALQGQFGALEKSGIRFTEAQQQMILFGTESEKVAALTEGLNQNLRETTDTIANTAEAGFAKLSQSMGDISESIGAAFLPIVSQVVEKIVPIVQKIGEWATENPKLVAAILGIVGVGGLLVAFIGTVGLIIPSVIAGFAALSSAVAFLGAAFTILSGPIGLIVLSIGLVIAAGIALYTHWDDVKGFALATWESIKTGLSNAMTAMVEIVTTVGQAISNAFWAFVNFNIGIFTTFLDFFFPGWQAAFQAAWNTTVLVFEGIKLAIFSAISWIKDTIIIPYLTAISVIWNGVWNGIKDAFSTLWESIKSIANGAFEFIQNGLDILTAPLETLVNLAERAYQAAKSLATVGGVLVGGAINRGSSYSGHRAMGGPVGTNHPYVVGENGPELFWPDQAGRISPNGAMGGGIQINITGNSFVGEEDFAERIGNQLIQIVKQNVKINI